MAIPGPGDEVARLTIVLYGDGQMGISGNMGDVNLATRMVESALDAVKSQSKNRAADGTLLGDHQPMVKPQILIPGRDVGTIDHHPAFPVVPVGDR
jgi:hypothetical protein